MDKEYCGKNADALEVLVRLGFTIMGSSLNFSLQFWTEKISMSCNQ